MERQPLSMVFPEPVSPEPEPEYGVPGTGTRNPRDYRRQRTS